MSKRLILVLALAFVLGIAFAAYAEVQNVKVSGDLTVIGATRNLNIKGEANDGSKSFTASIARVRIDADLTDNVMTTVRLLNERYWGRENTDNVNVGHTNTEIALDLAMVTLKEFLYSPLTLTVGRQELHFGNDMIVGDVDTNNQCTTASPFGALVTANDPDLTARKAFDAIRATLNYDPLVVDVVYAKVSVNNSNNIANDDTHLVGINANYALNKKTTVEGYWFDKSMGKKSQDGLVNAKKSDRVDTIGGRVITQPIDNLIYQLEMAYQFGKRARQSTDTPGTANSVNRKAWALETALTYNMPKVKYTPSVTGLYAYFSGDHENNVVNANNGAWRGWDPMYENQKFGDIANTQFDQTNAHILGGIATAKPVDDIVLKGEYYAYWWAKPYPDGTIVTTRRGDAVTATQRRFAGQEIDLTATYDYTEDVQFALMSGWFIPGKSFVKGNDTLASEVIGSMKVTF